MCPYLIIFHFLKDQVMAHNSKLTIVYLDFCAFVWSFDQVYIISIYPIVYKYNIFQSQKTLKNAIFRLKIPHFPRLFSSPGIPCQQIPHFLVSHEHGRLEIVTYEKNEPELSLYFLGSSNMGEYETDSKKIIPLADFEKIPWEISNRVSRRKTPFGINHRTR